MMESTTEFSLSWIAARTTRNHVQWMEISWSASQPFKFLLKVQKYDQYSKYSVCRMSVKGALRVSKSSVCFISVHHWAVMNITASRRRWQGYQYPVNILFWTKVFE